MNIYTSREYDLNKEYRSHRFGSNPSNREKPNTSSRVRSVNIFRFVLMCLLILMVTMAWIPSTKAQMMQNADGSASAYIQHTLIMGSYYNHGVLLLQSRTI